MGHSNLTDVVIAGAGIVGAACASEFARAGMTVAMVEPNAIGGGATAAGMGHLAVMDDSDAQFALTRYSQLLWKRLAERLPPSAEYLPAAPSGWPRTRKRWRRFIASSASTRSAIRRWNCSIPNLSPKPNRT